MGDIVYKGLGFGEPCLVALEEETDAVECHAGTAVHPRVVGENMEEQAVHAEGKMTVEERFDHSGRLVPDTTHFGESLGLHDILTVDVGTADGIEHVGGLVVRGTVEPELAHRDVHIFIMLHSVTDHRGRHTF